MTEGRSKVVDDAVQSHLDQCWKIVDSGETKADVIRWLRKLHHKCMSDWMAEEVALYMDRDTRKAEL